MQCTVVVYAVFDTRALTLAAPLPVPRLDLRASKHLTLPLTPLSNPLRRCSPLFLCSLPSPRPASAFVI